jgi:hypothetical protein
MIITSQSADSFALSGPLTFPAATVRQADKVKEAVRGKWIGDDMLSETEIHPPE